MKTQAVIVAAGMGARLGADMPKALAPVQNTPLIIHTARAFHSIGLLGRAIVTVPPDREAAFSEALKAEFGDVSITFVAGGLQRQDSVRNAIDALDDDTEIVAIHDAARPFVPPECITASIEAAAEFGAATVAMPSPDTILVADHQEFLADTPDRTRLWVCQTPQTFRVNVIREAHRRAAEAHIVATDDATLVQRTGCGRPKLVMGSAANIKITTPGDIEIAEGILAREKT